MEILIKNPISQLQNQELLNDKDAKAIAAPEIISYAGNSFF